MVHRFLHPFLALLACLLLIAAPACALGQVRLAEETVEVSEKLPGEETSEPAPGSPFTHRARVARPIPAAQLAGELHGDAPASHGVARRAPSPTPAWTRPLRC